MKTIKLSGYSYFLTFLILLSGSVVQAQDKSDNKKEIDVLITCAGNLIMHHELDKLLENAQSMLSKSNKINYEKGIVYANYYIAFYLTNNGKFKESNQYIRTSQRYTSYLETDYLQKSGNYRLIGDNYRELEFYPLAIKSYNHSLMILDRVPFKTETTTLRKIDNYYNLGVTYHLIEMKDSAFYYYNKNRTLLKTINSHKPLVVQAGNDVELGYYHADNDNMDSAHYYFDKSIALLRKINHPYEFYGLQGKAYAYTLQDSTDKALEVFHAGLVRAEENKLYGNHIFFYRALADLYGELKNYKLADVYNKKFILLNEKEIKDKNRQRTAVMNQLINQEKSNLDQHKKVNYLIIIMLSIFFVVVLLYTLYIIKRNNKINNLNFKYFKQFTKKQDSIIHQQEEDNQVLKDRVNESFEEIVQLAKENSHEFFSRFQEVYPDFVEKVLAVPTKLRLSELTLCAYIFLGFNTKDIALYTFKSLFTVRNRKTNLRKKFKLDSDESLELWMRNLMT